MPLATALALLIKQDVLTDVYCSKQTGSSSTKGNHHPSFLRFWNWAEENCRCSQNLVAAQKMLLKQKPINIHRIARFYYFRHFSTCWKRVCIASIIIKGKVTDMGNSICTAH